MVVCSGICPFDDWMADDWDDVYERTNAVNVKGTVNCGDQQKPAQNGGGKASMAMAGVSRRPSTAVRLVTSHEAAVV
jgi:hypothetical protein